MTPRRAGDRAHREPGALQAARARSLHRQIAMPPLLRLRAKLCRELSQLEHDARANPVREARRLGAGPPADALRAIADHAEGMRPRFEALMNRKGYRSGLGRGLGVGRAFGAMLAVLRHALFDRALDAERAYRGTLLEVRRGIDLLRLLREVASREGDVYLVRYCDEMLAERRDLVERAERALVWFAERPALAVRSGLRISLAPASASVAAATIGGGRSTPAGSAAGTAGRTGR